MEVLAFFLPPSLLKQHLMNLEPHHSLWVASQMCIRQPLKGRVLWPSLSELPMLETSNICIRYVVCFPPLLERSHSRFKAPSQGGCWMEMASAQEYPAIHWCHLRTSTFSDHIRIYGEWEYYTLYQDQTRPQPPIPCE